MQKLGAQIEAVFVLRKSGSWQRQPGFKTLPGVLTLFLFFVTFLQTRAQHSEGLLVRLKDHDTPASLLDRWERALHPSAVVEKKVSESLNVWLIRPQPSKTGTMELLEWLRRQPEVLLAQFNHLLTCRNTAPDDPFFPQQWQLNNSGQSGGLPGADMAATAAWDITTGGTTAAGDTIVVAVIDGGVAPHPDLLQNLWYNLNEIPNDGIDNDNNGYTDDYRGWNVWTSTDHIEGNSITHGTPVSALIGAKGNNGSGVAGVNWNIKIMFVAGSGSEASILESYDYIYKARKLYNQTHGQKGAFVVAVNCSWGVNYGNPDEAPIWCATLDTLGQAGVLSVAATANIPVNVDEVGDLPTTCPSDYMIAVTSLDHNNIKAENAAWGAQHIDLGAPGKNVFTASGDSGYGLFSGTSFAAPEVSGAVGLLYSSPCPHLIALAKSEPAAAAALVKDIILQSVAPNADLDNRTVSNGALHLHQMLQHYESQCSDCPTPFNLYADNLTTQAALLHWIGIADFETVKLRWRALTDPEWTEVSSASSPFQLDNLAACTSYEFSLSAYCTSTNAWSDWAAPFGFATDGCCAPPSGLEITGTSVTGCSGAWQPVTAATSYKYRIKEINSSVWDEWETTQTNYSIYGLLPCTMYEVQVLTVCDTGSTVYSPSIFFQTAGCGSCMDANYCSASAVQSTYEWIDYVSIGDWSHSSGPAGSGFQNFTGDLNNLLQIAPLCYHPVTIIPGYAGLPYKEFFRIYIDFNMDGDFDDAGELAFDPGYAHDAAISGQLYTPLFFTQGLTRMRVMMKFKNLNNSLPQPCESFDYGQVEDYCVELVSNPAPSTLTPREPMELRIFPQPVQGYVRLSFATELSGEWDWNVSDMSGRVFQSGRQALGKFSDILIPASAWKPGMYVIMVRKDNYVFKGKVVKAE